MTLDLGHPVQVSDIDVTKESPCGHGRVICFSLYGGSDIHFGAELPKAGAPRQDQLWVDTMLGNNEVSCTAGQMCIMSQASSGPSLHRTLRLEVGA